MRVHNVKDHQYTPGLVKQKVGLPATRFMCEVCKTKMKTENELRNRMKPVHKYPKRTQKEMKNEPIQRVLSIHSPP